MDEPLVEMVTGKPRAQLSPLVAATPATGSRAPDPVCTVACRRVT